MKRIHINIPSLMLDGVSMDDPQAFSAGLQKSLKSYFSDPANLNTITQSRFQRHLAVTNEMPAGSDPGAVAASTADMISRSIVS